MGFDWEDILGTDHDVQRAYDDCVAEAMERLKRWDEEDKREEERREQERIENLSRPYAPQSSPAEEEPASAFDEPDGHESSDEPYMFRPIEDELDP